MTKRIFRSIVAVALAVFLASLVFIFGILYIYFSDITRSNLKAETELAAESVETYDIGYLENINPGNYRYTLIDPEGKVLFDNSADKNEMENHLQREEIREAAESGTGESSRYSDTLNEKEFYYAVRLGNGNILRLSVSQATVWTLILSFAQPITIVIVIALVLSFILARGVSKKITGPINEIEPDSPENYLSDEKFREIKPLLEKMTNQKEQIRKDKEKIEETAKIRQDFTANISHELKTPLHVISGYAELIENGMVKQEDVKPFAGKIRRESSRLGTLVEDIINLTALDTWSGKDEKEKTDLYKIAENAVDALRSTADERNVTLSLAGASAILTGVPSVLYSIVYNLCDNAIKYNKDGGRVSITVLENDSSVILIVNDTGRGIPKEDIGRIFERFYRVNKSHSKEVGGTGLGLSIVKHGAAIHNASIDVRSEVGEGSEFNIVFPKSAVQ